MTQARGDESTPQQREGRRPLPHLNVRSPYLVYLYNIPGRASGRRLKEVIERDVGKVAFVETFQAWREPFIGSLIFEFVEPKVEREFLEMPHAWIRRHFGGVPTARVLKDEDDRQAFFHAVLDRTEVDLLECNGVPPSRWVERVTAARAEPPRVRPPRVEPMPFRPPRVEPPRVKRGEPLVVPIVHPSPEKSSAEESPSETSAATKSKAETASSIGVKYLVQIDNSPYGPDRLVELEKRLTTVLPLTWEFTEDVARAGFKDERSARLAATEWSGAGLEAHLVEDPLSVKTAKKEEEDAVETVTNHINLISFD